MVGRQQVMVLATFWQVFLSSVTNSFFSHLKCFERFFALIFGKVLVSSLHIGKLGFRLI